uniref:Uncharacterized protein n=1 Tax=Anguilla anguilla TaxID=7936 RepID=A0A0E9RKM8_ANGAN
MSQGWTLCPTLRYLKLQSKLGTDHSPPLARRSHITAP